MTIWLSRSNSLGFLRVMPIGCRVTRTLDFCNPILPFIDWETEALRSLLTLIPSPFPSQALLLKVILKSEGHADLGSHGWRKLQKAPGNPGEQALIFLPPPKRCVWFSQRNRDRETKRIHRTSSPRGLDFTNEEVLCNLHSKS